MTLSGPPLQVEYVALSALLPYARNMNEHSDQHVSELAASIKEFGWTVPVLIDKESVLVAGHGRVRAARLLGMEEVPCIRRDHWTEPQVRAYRIADNRLPKNADVNTAMLSAELQELQAAEFELGLLGFDQAELEALLNPEVPPEPGNGDPDKVPDQADTRCKPGDVWVLGDHRLICGDATRADDIDRLMAGERADICFTSPPYNVGKTVRGNLYRDDADDKSDADYVQFLCDVTALMMAHACYAFVNLQMLSANKTALVDYLARHRDHLKDVLIWNKSQCPPNIQPGAFNTKFEFVFAFTAGDASGRKFEGCEWQGVYPNVVEGNSASGNAYADQHGATFPVYLPTWFIEKLTKPGSIVIDCFGGSGTTLIACESSGRRCRMSELDPKYCDIILARWEAFTGLEAQLAEG